jgi:hypothetical protein
MSINVFDWDTTLYGVLQDFGGHLQHLANVLSAHIITIPLTEKGRKKCFSVGVILSKVKDPTSKSMHGTVE